MERHGITHDQALQQMIHDARAAGASLVKVSERLVAKVPPSESQEGMWALIHANRSSADALIRPWLLRTSPRASFGSDTSA